MPGATLRDGQDKQGVACRTSRYIQEVQMYAPATLRPKILIDEAKSRRNFVRGRKEQPDRRDSVRKHTGLVRPE